MYWFVFFVYIIISLYLTVGVFRNIQKKNFEKIKLNKDFDMNKYNQFESSIVKVIIITFISGVISSMVGVGGGIIMIPLMLSLGLDPRVKFCIK